MVFALAGCKDNDSPSASSNPISTGEPTDGTSRPGDSASGTTTLTNDVSSDTTTSANDVGSGTSTSGSSSRSSNTVTTSATALSTQSGNSTTSKGGDKVSSTSSSATTTSGNAGNSTPSKVTYDLKKSMDFVWEGDTAYQEMVLPLQDKDGKVVMPLLYKADKILKVESATLTTVYKEGKDYVLQSDGTMLIPDGSAIRSMPYADMYPTASSATCLETLSGSYESIFYPGVLHAYFVCVTYTHNDRWTGPAIESKGAVLSNFWSKVHNGEDVTIVFTGDSVTSGGDVSGLSNLSPYIPPYPTLMGEYLNENYPNSKFTVVNAARGGTVVDWGANTTKTRVMVHNPDLVVVAFGANPGGFSKTQYKSYTKTIIDKVRTVDPTCDIVLVAGTVQNQNFKAYNFAPVLEYRDALFELSNDYERVLAVDVRSIQEHVLTRKRLVDITANNLNHNNDYFCRVYAQILIKAILE